MISRPRSRRRPSLLAVAATLVLASAGIFAAAPASAHDALVSSDPAADTTLDALPGQLTLTFSAELLAGGGNEVQVTDAGGASLTDGPATIDGVTLRQPISGDGTGTITVVWRVVSSDGHPISGQYAFTVTAPPSPTPSATDQPTSEPTPASTAVAPIGTATPTPDPTLDEAGANLLPWIIGGIVLLIAVGGGVVAILVRLARRSDGGDAADSDDTAGR